MSKEPQRVVIGWEFPDGSQGTLIVDVTISETHQFAAEVTKHQVETGSDIADHIRPVPNHLSLECMISNWPIGKGLNYLNGVRGSTQQIERTVGGQTVKYTAFKFDTEIERVKQVAADLVQAIQGAALFNIFTTLTTYENMACTGFNIPRSAGLGQSLRFTMDFEFIRTVDTQTVAALPPKAQKKHRGAKSGKEKTGDDKAKRRSTLKALISAVGG